MGLHFIKNGTKHDVCVKRPSLLPASATTYDNSQSGLAATRVQGAIDELGARIAVLSDNIGASVNTWYSFNYPSGFNTQNSVIIGYSAETNDSHLWYSNHSEVTVIGGTSGISVKTSSTAYTNTPFKVFLAKV